MRSPLNLLSVEEYFKFKQDGEIRHEYVAGQKKTELITNL